MRGAVPGGWGRAGIKWWVVGELVGVLALLLSDCA
jgi:hypothetical protein